MEEWRGARWRLDLYLALSLTVHLLLPLSVSPGVSQGRESSTPSPSSLGGRLLQKAGQLMGLGGSSSSAEVGEGAHGKEKAEVAGGWDGDCI